ncbi:MAG: efflux RND transporter periplasmic adaptor subunit [Acidocella sp.]|nr:efflux RND transporter periplasmic adaptor subunit [Acidocella sp.]
MNRRPGKVVLLAASAVAILVICIIIGLRAHAQTNAGNGGQGHNAVPVPVSLAMATLKDVPVSLSNIGTVQAYQSVLVRARVDGTLNSINFTEGQMVQPGELLAQLDPRPYQAALDAAKAKAASDAAALLNDRKNAARDQALLKDSFASRQTFDNDTAAVAQMQANLQGDQAAIDAAQLNLTFTSITSPISGRAGLRLVDPGNQIHATDTAGIVQIDQIQPITLLFSLPQDNLPAIQKAMAHGTLKVSAYTTDGSTLLGNGQLLTIDNEIDPASGTFRLKAVFPNANTSLWPGQSVTATLQVQTLKNVVTVPSTAINRGPDGLYVYVAKPDHSVAMVPVKVSHDDGQSAVVGKGISAGMQVVTDGQSKLQTGSKIIERSTPAGS